MTKMIATICNRHAFDKTMKLPFESKDGVDTFFTAVQALTKARPHDHKDWYVANVRPAISYSWQSSTSRWQNDPPTT